MKSEEYLTGRSEDLRVCIAKGKVGTKDRRVCKEDLRVRAEKEKVFTQDR
jgi:hypothetical protein